MRLLLPLLVSKVVCQTTYVTGTFAYAIWASSPTISSAVQATCPADHPQRCDSIGEPDYCCAWGYYCAWAGNVVGCCPQGQQCAGVIAGPSPTYATATTYVPVYTTAPTVVTTYAPATTTVNGGICSTLTANGNGVPTTRAGNCGTILVVSDATRSTTTALAVLSSLIGVLILSWR